MHLLELRRTRSKNTVAPCSIDFADLSKTYRFLGKQLLVLAVPQQTPSNKAAKKRTLSWHRTAYFPLASVSHGRWIPQSSTYSWVDTCDWLATYVQVQSTLVLLGRWFNVSNEQNVFTKDQLLCGVSKVSYGSRGKRYRKVAGVAFCTVAPIPAMIPCGTGNFCGSFLLPRHALNRSRLIMLNGLIFFLSFWFSLKLLFLMFFPMAFYVFLELSHSPLPPIPRISPTAGRSSFHHHFLGHASTAWCHRWARPHARRAGTQSPLSCYGDGYFRFWVYIMGI